MSEDYSESAGKRNSNFLKRACAALLVVVAGIVFAPVIIALGFIAAIRRR